jgi:hypothetical protein
LNEKLPEWENKFKALGYDDESIKKEIEAKSFKYYQKWGNRSVAQNIIQDAKLTDHQRVMMEQCSVNSPADGRKRAFNNAVVRLPSVFN